MVSVTEDLGRIKRVTCSSKHHQSRTWSLLHCAATAETTSSVINECEKAVNSRTKTYFLARRPEWVSGPNRLRRKDFASTYGSLAGPSKRFVGFANGCWIRVWQAVAFALLLASKEESVQPIF
jgi:hypothetical protein